MWENVKRIICISIFLVFASGCAQTVENPTETSSFTSTIIPASSSTPISTFTPEPTILAIPTLIPVDSEAIIFDSLESPSNRYFALAFYTYVNMNDNSGESENKGQLKIYDRFADEEIVVETLIKEKGAMLPWYIPIPLAWSEDEGQLYYTHYLKGADGCFGEKDRFGTNLMRFDLESGESKLLIKQVGNWVALSPDLQTFAAFKSFMDGENYKTQIILFDVNSGDEKQKIDILNLSIFTDITLTFNSSMIWSPNSKFLAYGILDNVCGGAPNLVTTSLIIYSLETNKHTILFLESENRVLPVSWEEGGLINLEQWDGDEKWQFDFYTGELFQIEN